MKTAIYTRNISQKNAKDQIKVCSKWAKSNGHIIQRNHIYSDIDSLLAAAQGKCFEALLVFTTDRLGRDLNSSLLLLNTLHKYEVRVFLVGEDFVVNDVMTRCFFAIKAIFTELQSETYRANTIRGQEAAIRNGSIPGVVGYGYKLEKICKRPPDLNGRERTGGSKAIIVKEEARAIRRIFNAYARGQSTREIALALNKEKIPFGSSGIWTPSKISKLLDNEKYTGKLIWRKTSRKMDRFSGKPSIKQTDPNDWVITEHPEMRIVSDELWNAVHSRRKKAA